MIAPVAAVESKTCTKCGEAKTLDAFYKASKGRPGHTPDCKVCRAAAHRTWRHENPDTWKRAKRKAQANHRTRQRERVLAYLGNACARCGFDDVRALQVDHVNGGGNQESRQIGSHGVMRRVLAGVPGYQLLCANCNWIKRVENGEAPVSLLKEQ